MRLVTFRNGAEPRLGAQLDDRIIDLARAAEAGGNGAVPSDILELLQGGEQAMDAARAALDHAAGQDGDWALPAADVELLPPVPRPPKIVCVARNYAAHAREANLDVLEIPNLFARFAQTLIPHGAPILRPTVSEEVDWEGELAVVIGRGGRHINQADAYEHVAGYSIFNDVSVRDYQFRVPQFVGGKNFDASGPFGPALVTRDEIEDPHDLQLELTVNDEVMQSASTGDMIFSIPQIIENISEFVTLEPGDVIATGTPSGVGFTRKPPRFLTPGDVCRVTITGVGTLENPVEQEQE